jgi:hypothetical protein
MDAVIEASPDGRLPAASTEPAAQAETTEQAERLYRYGRAVAILLTLLVALCFSTRLGGSDVEQTISNVALPTAALAAAVACGWRARGLHGRIAWSWGLIGAGVLSWGLGQAVWTLYESVLGIEVPFPSLADVGYLGMPVFTAAGLLAIPMASQSIAPAACWTA